MSFAFKRYARPILWSSAIALFAGTLLLVGVGVINPVNGDKTGSTTFWGTIITLISGASLAFCAEILKEKNKGKTNINGNIIGTPVLKEQAADIDATVVLSGTLNTELAKKVFCKAIEAGYMEECCSHYKWNDSKVLLAYMCGRIYCGDYPERFKMETKTYWKFGMELFPDTELCALFATSDIGQSRQNRKDLTVPKNFQKIDIFLSSQTAALFIYNQTVKRAS